MSIAEAKLWGRTIAALVGAKERGLANLNTQFAFRGSNSELALTAMPLPV